MGNIEKISKIKRETLSGEFYFKSLLEQAYGIGLLSSMDIEKIQLDCLVLLKKKIAQYNSNGSSSIRVEAAQNLMESIMFTIGLGLKSYPEPDDAVAAIKKDSMDGLYQNGRKHIDRFIKSTKVLYSSIIGNLVQTKNEFYNSTIIGGIKGFFKLYCPEFAAQEIHITADYPVHHRIERLQGIEFIRKYLECVYYENLFCTHFSAKDVHHLLCGYNENYEQLLFNVYEPILSAAIGCIFSGGDVYRLEMTPSSFQRLDDLFQGKTKAEIEELLMDATSKLSKLLELSESLKRYLMGSLPEIAALIKNATQIQTLDRFFVLHKYPENNPKLIVSS